MQQRSVVTLANRTLSNQRRESPSSPFSAQIVPATPLTTTCPLTALSLLPSGHPWCATRHRTQVPAVTPACCRRGQKLRSGGPPATTPPRVPPPHLTILTAQCPLTLGAPPPDMPTIPVRPRTRTPPPEVPLPVSHQHHPHRHLTRRPTTALHHAVEPKLFSSPPVWAWPADRPDTRRLASSPAANLPRKAESS